MVRWPLAPSSSTGWLPHCAWSPPSGPWWPATSFSTTASPSPSSPSPCSSPSLLPFSSSTSSVMQNQNILSLKVRNNILKHLIYLMFNFVVPQNKLKIWHQRGLQAFLQKCYSAGLILWSGKDGREILLLRIFGLCHWWTSRLSQFLSIHL